MRELNDREMEQAQGGFGSLHSGYREFGISREALMGSQFLLQEVETGQIAETSQNLPQATLRPDDLVRRAWLQEQRDARQLERGRPFRQGAFRSRFLNR